MPIYEYKCSKCDNIFEKLSFSVRVPATKEQCPECGGSGVRQVSQHAKMAVQWAVDE